jgi:hypothetical protein
MLSFCVVLREQRKSFYEVSVRLFFSGSFPRQYLKEPYSTGGGMQLLFTAI